jgi:ribosomal 30S subunit maturation factor RimM
VKSSGLEYITVAQILAPWGTEGKLRVEVVTDFPHHLAPHSPVYVDRKPMTIASTSWHKGQAIIKLEGIDSTDDAKNYAIKRWISTTASWNHSPKDNTTTFSSSALRYGLLRVSFWARSSGF